MIAAITTGRKLEITTSISTLVPDIYSLVKSRGWFNEQLATEFAEDISSRLQTKFNEEAYTPKLRLSKMGPGCPKAFWYSLYRPDLAEPLPAWAEIKYTYGHILEALAIAFTKASGHEVTGEQDAIEVDGITGHRDCVIDGCIVDVKSTSSRGFIKFKDGSIEKDDGFGYLDQLDGYLVGSLEDPLVRVKDRAYLLAIDKQLGHVCLHEHSIRESSIRSKIRNAKLIADSTEPPSCTCKTRPDGASGNIALDMRASYSPFKYCCFPHLRAFLYSDGPRYLTHVVRRPDVPEIDRHGKIIYN